MTDEPKPRKIVRKNAKNQFKPSGVTPERAWELKNGEKIETLEALKERFARDGVKISVARLSTLLNRMPAYVEAQAAQSNKAGRRRSARVEEALQIVADAQEMEAGLRAKTYQGARVALITRLIKCCETLKIETPDDVIKSAEADAKLQMLVHDLRGMEISNGASSGGKVKLSDSPPPDSGPRIVPMAPFVIPKKTG